MPQLYEDSLRILKKERLSVDMKNTNQDLEAEALRIATFAEFDIYA